MYEPPCLTTRSQSIILDGALGGCSPEGDPNSWFPEMWEWLVDYCEIKSVFDVGCGCGHAMKFFHEKGLQVWGIEGSAKVLEKHLLPQFTFRADLTVGEAWRVGTKFDLVWCCEVGEHLQECFARQLVRTCVAHAASLIAFCAAPPGCGGHHHVNCRYPGYWVSLFEQEGCLFDEELTMQAKLLCGENKYRVENNYFQRSGLIFRAP